MIEEFYLFSVYDLLKNFLSFEKDDLEDENNEILYKTQKEALEYAIEIICGWRADGKELRRDMRLKLILDL